MEFGAAVACVCTTTPQRWSRPGVAPVSQVRLPRVHSVPVAASALPERSFQLEFHPEGAQLQKTSRPLCSANPGAIGEEASKVFQVQN